MGVRYLVTWNEILHSNDLARLHVLGPQVDGRQRKITRINVIPFLKVLCKLKNLTFTHKNLTTTTSGFRFHHWSNKGIWRWQAICSDPKEQNNDEKKGFDAPHSILKITLYRLSNMVCEPHSSLFFSLIDDPFKWKVVAHHIYHFVSSCTCSST